MVCMVSEVSDSGNSGNKDICRGNIDSGGDGTTQNPPQLQCTEEGYIVVDSCLQTNVPHVYAAGDCCAYPAAHIDEVLDSSGAVSHFFQMRLWTQV